MLNKIIVAFLLATSTVFAFKFSLSTGNHGAFCVWVEAKHHYGDSFVRLLVNETVQSYKVPGLIIKSQDIGNFSSVPTFEDFYRLYRNNRTELYSKILGSDGRFNVDASERHSIDELKFWSGIIDKEITFSVTESGVYCVYIAPDPTKIPNFKLPIHIRNYYGELSYYIYPYYTAMKWFFSVLVASVAILFYFQRAKVAHKLTPVKAITNTFVLMTFVPFTVDLSLEVMNLFIENSVPSLSANKAFVSILERVIFFAVKSREVLDMYVALLFSMGLGVIYYYHDEAQNYRKFPQDWFKIATAFLLVHMLLALLLDLSVKRMMNTDTLLLMGTTTQISTHGIYRVINFIMSIFTYACFMMSVLFYFKTRKRITMSPPNSDIGSADRVISAFKWSNLVIWIMPQLFKILHNAVMTMDIIWLYDLSTGHEEEAVQSADFPFYDYLLFVLSGDSMGVYESWQMILPWIITLIPTGTVLLIWYRASSRPAVSIKAQ